MVIHINALSLDSINKARKQIQTYKRKLPKKCEALARRLAELGSGIANVTFSGAVYDLDALTKQPIAPADITVSYEQDFAHNGHYTIHADGEAVAFVEFGAGVFYNSTGSDRIRPEGIVGIGEYGKCYGKRKAWGFTGKDGQPHIVRGTPEQPGMWLAARTMRQDILKIAREVFAE